MAELELTKIEQGMANGGTAIGANFDATKAAIDAGLQDTGWVKLTLASGITNDTVNIPAIRRIGSTVYYRGTANTKGAVAKIFDVPAGFRPTAAVHADLPMQSGTVTEFTRVYIENNVASVVASTNIAKFFFLDQLSHDTNDDFPS